MPSVFPFVAEVVGVSLSPNVITSTSISKLRYVRKLGKEIFTVTYKWTGLTPSRKKEIYTWLSSVQYVVSELYIPLWDDNCRVSTAVSTNATRFGVNTISFLSDVTGNRQNRIAMYNVSKGLFQSTTVWSIIGNTITVASTLNAYSVNDPIFTCIRARVTDQSFGGEKLFFGGGKQDDVDPLTLTFVEEG